MMLEIASKQEEQRRLMRRFNGDVTPNVTPNVIANPIEDDDEDLHDHEPVRPVRFFLFFVSPDVLRHGNDFLRLFGIRWIFFDKQSQSVFLIARRLT
jgi:hypothetical protein